MDYLAINSNAIAFHTYYCLELPVVHRAEKIQHCPYLTGCWVFQYFCKIATLPIQDRGAVPSEYSPDHFPTNTPLSSGEFTLNEIQ